MRRLGDFPTEKELRVMVAQVDQVSARCAQIIKLSKPEMFIYISVLQDNNGTIEMDEFLAMMATRVEVNEKIKKVFKVFDQNGDG